MIRFISSMLDRWKKSRERYIYGSVYRPEDGHKREGVRLDKTTGRVQFVLWKAGQQGHTEDYWHNMGYGWEAYFTPDSERQS